MEIKNTLQELAQKVGVGRLILIVCAGVLLVVLSLPSSNQKEIADTPDSTEHSEHDLALQAMEEYTKKKEKSTEEILSQVDGVGKVRVMITLSASEEKIPLQDADETEEESKEQNQEGSSRNTTSYQSKRENILISQDGKDSPYVVQICSPAIEGVVVVAQGAASAKVKTEIIEAIQALFSIEVHKIKVMKMG